MRSDMRKKLPSALFYILFITFTALFIYFRIGSVLYKTVGYTYDQGRDFLKVSEIILQKNITFIGPTTGIEGLFHGAWYYYILTIPFIIFNGLPIGFYYFNLCIYLLMLLGIFYFCYRHFHLTIAIVTTMIMITSPYFVFLSIFVGNNILAPPALLLFIYFNYLLINKDKKLNYSKWLFISIGLSLGMVMEFELSFGLLLIPSYFLMSLILPKLRNNLFKLKEGASFLLGLGLALIPRLLFELKNNFQQTKVLLGFFLKPKLHNPKAYFNVISERFQLFVDYYKSLFPNQIILWLTSIIIIFSLLYLIKRKVWKKSFQFIFFSSGLIFFLFFLSTFYKDNFWNNYYEGIQFLFISIIILLLSLLYKENHKLGIILNGAIICSFAIYIFFNIKPIIKPPDSGLVLREKIVETIYNEEKAHEKFCVKIYTPPVIPYTYDYLFQYYSRKNNRLIPEKDWIEKRCWLIVEKDDYQFRADKWINDNLPKENKLLKKTTYLDIVLYYYEKK